MQLVQNVIECIIADVRSNSSVTTVTAWSLQLSVIVENIPVVFARVSGIPAPCQILLGSVVLHNEFHHAPREQSVKFALDERSRKSFRFVEVDGSGNLKV